MNYLDIYYRALIDYRKNTADFRDCINQRLSAAKANAKDDNITITRKICSVDRDWVEAIEKGLVHVEKAIREERQFIRSNGEIIDIEKVKNVSKDSVEHLARHSNLISRYEEGEDVVPDRLYTVERLSDFAVYENRFLYMLLCYLRDFITVRYNKILELEHTYNGSMSMNKTIVMTKRSLAFEIKMQEERKDDLYLKKQSESRDIIVRIGNQLKLVLAFLATPLMQEVAKAPMLKPPITKTNVLRMNHDFRGALALYEFISAYDKPGYTAEESVSVQSPLRLDVADEMAEIVMMTSFLTYEHGLNLKGELQIEYDKEEERRKEEEKKKLLDQLRALRHRIRESGENPEEYMLMLEKTNKMLLEDRERLFTAKQEIDSLKEEIAGLERDKKTLSGEITRLGDDIEELKKNHSAQLDSINKTNEDERTRMVNVYDEKIAQMDAQATKKDAQHKNEIDELTQKGVRDVEEAKEAFKGRISDLEATCQGKDAAYKELEGEFDALTEKYRLATARLTALRHEKGLKHDIDDFSGEEAFKELEEELSVFVEFFKKQWGITKKTIRKKAFKELKAIIKEDKLKKGQKDSDTLDTVTQNEQTDTEKSDDLSFVASTLSTDESLNERTEPKDEATQDSATEENPRVIEAEAEKEDIFEVERRSITQNQPTDNTENSLLDTGVTENDESIIINNEDTEEIATKKEPTDEEKALTDDSTAIDEDEE